MAIPCKIIHSVNPADLTDSSKMTVRAIQRGTYGFERMADEITNACSLTKPDVIATMSAMTIFATKALLNGYAVELEGLGKIRINVKSRLCTLDETQRRGFLLSDVIEKYMIRFVPDVRLYKHVTLNAEPQLIY